MCYAGNLQLQLFQLQLFPTDGALTNTFFFLFACSVYEKLIMEYLLLKPADRELLYQLIFLTEFWLCFHHQ